MHSGSKNIIKSEREIKNVKKKMHEEMEKNVRFDLEPKDISFFMKFGNNWEPELQIIKDELSSYGLALLGSLLTNNTVIKSLFIIDGINNTINISSLRGNTISLSKHNYGDLETIVISSFVHSNKILTNLDLSDNKIGDPGAKALCQALKDKTKVTSVDLRYNSKIGSNGAKMFSEVIIKNKSIKTFSHIPVSDLRENNCTVMSLIIQDAGIGITEAMVIASLLQINTILKTLNLSNSPWQQGLIGDIGATAIAEALRQNTTLLNLNLTGNEITDIGSKNIGNILKDNSTLLSLGMAKNNIGDIGVTSIAASLKCNTTLTELNLNGNRIGDAGAAQSGNSLKKNSTLVNLLLGDNQIGDNGVQAIAESLEYNSTLKELYLGVNRIGDVGAQAISKRLKQNSTLLELYLGVNKIGDVGAQAIGKGLKKNSSLKVLSLLMNQISDRGIEAIVDGFKENKTLQTIYLNKNKISESGKQVLKDATMNHSSIKLCKF